MACAMKDRQWWNIALALAALLIAVALGALAAWGLL